MKWETEKRKKKLVTRCRLFEKTDEIDKSLDKMIRKKTQITNIWKKKGKTTIDPRNTKRVTGKHQEILHAKKFDN